MGVLKAFAKHHPDIGYCQGMNYVASALIVLYNTPHPDEPPLAGMREDTGTAARRLVLALPGHAHIPRACAAHTHTHTAEVVFWLLAALARRYACDQLWRPRVPRLR